jgi:tetrahydromethanopterin S-methyltransferase subunit C
LRDLSDSIRTSFDLLATAGTEQALAIARAQEEQTAKLGDLLSAVGFLLLGPSLVAALLALGSPSEVFSGGRLITSFVAFVVGVVLTVVAMYFGRRVISRRR